MASPQIEDGYTRISNELLDAIAKSQFNATQLKILLVCMRRTYGYQKKEAELSLTFLSKGTGTGKRYIQREILKLLDDNVLILVRESTFKNSRIISLNKDYTTWNSRTIEQQTVNCTTGEQLNHTTDGLLTYTTDGLLTVQKRNKKNTKERSEFGVSLREKDIGSESDLVLPEKKSNKEIDDFFETIWQLYPIKKGKAEVKPSAKRELYKLGFDKIKSAIEKYTKETTPKYYMHGRRFFNTSYIDYVTCDSTPKKQEIKFIEVDADDYRDNFEKYYKP
jgi:phage replication O-like protein O